MASRFSVDLFIVLLLIPLCLHALPHAARASTPVRRMSLASPISAPASVYIVQLRATPPAVAYSGGIPGFDATAPESNPEPEDEPTDGEDEEDYGTAEDTDEDPAATPAGTPPAAPAAGATESARILAGVVTGAARGAAVAAARFRSRRRKRLPRLNTRAPHVRAFVAMLTRQQKKVAADVGVSAGELVHSYTYTANGFAARMTPAQAAAMRKHPLVGDVRASRTVQLHTTDSPKFLRLPGSLWRPTGGGRRGTTARPGKNVIVGIVDTGVWPEHPSFTVNSSSTFGRLPRHWSGTCQRTADFRGCNGKVVGARFFLQGFKMSGHDLDTRGEYLSARDSDGHGSWCAGAAAGNSNVRVATSIRRKFGLASGMAPSARIAVYKVFWRAEGNMFASYADVEAAVDQAVADGVDVLSLSLGSSDSSANYFNHLGYLNANKAGVVVAFAAGNEGIPGSLPGIYRTVCNFSPFYLTVGASSIRRRWFDRKFVGRHVIKRVKKIIGRGKEIIGRSLGKRGYHTSSSSSSSSSTDPDVDDDDDADAFGPEDTLEDAEVTAEDISSLPVIFGADAAVGAAEHSRGISSTSSSSTAAISTSSPSTSTSSSAAAAAAAPAPSSSSAAALCTPGSLSSSLAGGRVVVCAYGGVPLPLQVAAVAAAGGRALMLTGALAGGEEMQVDDSFKLPVIMLGEAIANALKEFTREEKKQRSGGSGTAAGSVVPSGLASARFSSPANVSSPIPLLAPLVDVLLSAPAVADFSSTGPLLQISRDPEGPYPTNDILKPDIIAPGISLWAASPAADGTRTLLGALSRRPAVFAQLSGTSMSTPHIAGVAALMRQRHPAWSAAQIMSAIMTTAGGRNDAGKAIRTAEGEKANPFHMGAGHVNPPGLVDAGLTYDAGHQDYVNFLAGQNEGLAQAYFGDLDLKPTPAYDLNRPVISVSRLSGSVVVTRRVTNVSRKRSTYVADLDAPSHVRVKVRPSRFSIAPGQTVAFTVKLVVLEATGRFSFGSLTWRDNLGHRVRTTLAVQPIKR